MAQPKRRWSKARTRTKRATWKLDNKNLATCDNCHEAVLPHRACPNCGYYNGRVVIKMDEE